jgi:Rrf2 family transcriptional regulator, iron-sulfur cluster assembly transcription factor
MRLSTRGRYAVMAMVELATRQRDRGAGGHISLGEVAEAQALSLAYLEQLFGHLRRAGLVAGARGPGGGYRLARPAAGIAIADIADAVEEPLRATRCEENSPGCLAGRRCLTHDLWFELSAHLRGFLAGVTLADVVEGRIAGRAGSALPVAALDAVAD